MANGSTALPLHPVRQAGTTRTGSRVFYVGFSAAALLTVFVGFAPSFTRPWRGLPPLPLRDLAHGIAFIAWVVLFAVQSALVASGRRELHRRLGVAGAALALVMVVTSVPLALSAAGRGTLPGDPIAFLLVVLVDLLTFGVFTATAIHYRNQSETHSRLMALALASLLPPAVSRWPIAVRYPMIISVVLLLFVAAVPMADVLARRRPSAVSLWGGLALMASVPLRFAIARTEPWREIAGWLIRWTAAPYGYR